jgi:hypothetical protein
MFFSSSSTANMLMNFSQGEKVSFGYEIRSLSLVRKTFDFATETVDGLLLEVHEVKKLVDLWRQHLDGFSRRCPPC